MHELSNGRYRVVLSEAGGGQSSWDWIALSRWPGADVEDALGFFIYLRDLDSGAQWSAGLQPSLSLPDRYEVRSTERDIRIERADHGIASTLTVGVDGTADIETRSLRLHNSSAHRRRIQLCSYVEVALAHPRSDLEHPAFLKLFVQTELAASSRALIAKRRPRAHGETWPALFHLLSGAEVEAWETDRLNFIGRGRSLAQPAMQLRGTVGNVLDPIFSLRCSVELAAGETRELSFLLGVVADHAQLDAVLARHSAPGASAPAKLDIEGPVVRPTAGFNAEGSEYVMRLHWTGTALALPPMPWVNVIANERCGCIVSETGAGGSWARNSQANRITPWSNDPVCDPHGEACFIRDEDSGLYWSPLPGPAPAAVEHEVRHGFGYSRFSAESHELLQEATVFVAQDDPVKILRLRLQHRGRRPRRLSLYGYQQLVLGTLPEYPGTIRSWHEGQVLCASKADAGDFSGGIAFAFAVGSGMENESICCDRRSFIGSGHSLRAPRALSQPQLDGACGADLDPCFARQLQFTLQPGECAEFSFVLGEALGADELQQLVARYADSAAIDAAFEQVSAGWRETLGRLRVQSASPELDHMVNGWLPYQALSSRMRGRTAFYQSSGAYGFRDQLQDAGNLCLLWPQRTRQQILLHAQHQFEQGDVLHWWHGAPVERGVRTRFSDDRLWLPYVTLHYLQCSGDNALLDEAVPFLQAAELKAAEDENYLRPTLGEDRFSLYEHCCRALDRSLHVGAHGLPLMGTGDWNDGMNRVGREGRGESVWLGFFLYQILAGFTAFARQRGDAARAERYAAYREQLGLAVNDAGWDGAWYRRAYYDDGTPLGTHDDAECRIDGLAQAWSVLSGAAPPARAAQAMDAAEAQLIDEADGLIRLLTPPFVNAAEDPGYIKGYVAGVRENGGQYTHAACWVVAALAKLGRRERALRLLTMLSPQWHTRSAAEIERYKVEPYVIAADIYGAAPHIGRGGWTWYTGAAGWAYRVAVEAVLGLRMEGGRQLLIRPCVPDEWPDYRIEYRLPESQTRYVIDVRNPQRRTAAVLSATLDGRSVPLSAGTARIDITDDGALHEVVVTLG